MRRFLPFAIFALAGAQAAQAQDGGAVTVDIGQVVTVRVDEGGAIAVAPGGSAGLSEFDRGAVEALTGLPVEAASGPNSAAFSLNDLDLPQPRPITPAAIRILFARMANGESVLVLENGYGQALSYHARIHRAGETERTDVCTVLPNLRGYEHWPYQIDRIELSHLRLEPWPELQQPRCE